MIKTTNIKQTVTIKASAHEIYDALLDSKKHSTFTGEDAKLGRNAGDSFSVYGGYATGKNLELVKDKKIIQSWRASDWPNMHFSVVTFLLKQTKTGTKLTLNHKDVPFDQAKSISDGWKTYYWKPLKEMLEK